MTCSRAPAPAIRSDSSEQRTGSRGNTAAARIRAGGRRLPGEPFTRSVRPEPFDFGLAPLALRSGQAKSKDDGSVARFFEARLLRLAAALAPEPDVRAEVLVLPDPLEVEDDREEVEREGERAEELPQAHSEDEQDGLREDDAHHHEPERDERGDRGDEDEPADRQAGDHSCASFCPACSAAATGGRPLPPWANARGWIFSPLWQSMHFASPLRMSSSMPAWSSRASQLGAVVEWQRVHMPFENDLYMWMGLPPSP